MEKEMKTAEAAQRDTSNLVQNFLDEIRSGKSVDVQLARSAVSQCVAGVLRNPSALMFITRMRQQSQFLADHAFNVCIYSIILGRLNGFAAKQMESIGTCGLLHDIGNIAISEQILNKASTLSQEEFETVKKHTNYGKDILMSGRNIFAGAVDVAFGHHECLDGSGYPRGLWDQHINLNCRVVSVVDKYEALTGNTPYRSALSHLDAVHLLNFMAEGNKIDKRQNSIFLSYLGFYPPGSIVELSSGETAIVLKSSDVHRLRPQVLVVRDVERAPVERFVDLALKNVDGKGKHYKIKMVHPAGYLGIDPTKYKNAVIQAYE